MRKIPKNFRHLVNSYNAGYRGVSLEGGSRCFDGGQKVCMLTECKQIRHVLPGDMLYSYNEKTNDYDLDVVESVNMMQNKKKCYEVTLKNGEKIRCTHDHKFYINGKWLTMDEIKKEYESRKVEKNPGI